MEKYKFGYSILFCCDGLKINYKTIMISAILGIIIASLMGYWIYHALGGFPSREFLPIALGLILFCSATWGFYNSIETYKQKKKQN